MTSSAPTRAAKSAFTAAQRTATAHALNALAEAFPDLTPRQLVAGPLAEAAFGALPFYSNLSAHRVVDVTTAPSGSFVFCHAEDRAARQPLILMIRRADGSYGVPGGYINLDFKGETPPPVEAAKDEGEQPVEGAVRELGEEVCDDQGRPVLAPEPSRLRVVASGVDYRAVPRGGLPVHYDGHALHLTRQELFTLKRHVARCAADPAYRAAAFAAARDEVTDVMLMPLSRVAALPAASFGHPHEHSALMEFCAMLRPCASRPLRRHAPACIA